MIREVVRRGRYDRYDPSLTIDDGLMAVEFIVIANVVPVEFVNLLFS
jgi:hypothetical protein